MSTKSKRSLTDAIGDVLVGPAGTAYADSSPKQRLVLLRDAGHLNPMMCQAMARRFDELRTHADERTAFAEVVREHDEGKLRIEASAGTRVRAPHVFEAETNESLKQTLIWLMQQGSLSRAEAQRVAAKLDAHKGDDEMNVTDLAYVLWAEGCLNALPEGWEPEGRAADLVVVGTQAAFVPPTSPLRPIKFGEDPEEWLREQLAAVGLPAPAVDAFVAEARAVVAPLADTAVTAMREPIERAVEATRAAATNPADSAGAEEEQEGDNGGGLENDERTGAEKMVAQGFTAQHLHRQTVPQVEGFVSKVDDMTVLDLLRDFEQQNPSREGGRTGVLQAIEARVADLVGDALDESEL